ACCRHDPVPDTALPSNAATACAYGLRLGLHCIYSCASLTAVLFTVGIMNPYAMTAVTAAITIERLAPASYRGTRVIGIAIVALGLFLMAHGIHLSSMPGVTRAGR
ncbi:MAG TPA: DUF2182 domain-containing protein, partial [Bordetella sp.]|nr:DUF2182 domain-containing protein [Bordetella sp.]